MVRAPTRRSCSWQPAPCTRNREFWGASFAELFRSRTFDDGPLETTPTWHGTSSQQTTQSSAQPPHAPMLRTSLRTARALSGRPLAAAAGRQWQVAAVRPAGLISQVSESELPHMLGQDVMRPDPTSQPAPSQLSIVWPLHALIAGRELTYYSSIDRGATPTTRSQRLSPCPRPTLLPAANPRPLSRLSPRPRSPLRMSR